MPGKTFPVRALVNTALSSVSQPYTEDVILEVCQVIKVDPKLKSQYDSLCGALTKHETNKAIGRYTKSLTGLETLMQVDAPANEIVGSYSKLKKP